MKLNCRKEKKEEWHKWFAWYPVKIGENDCRWLEVVERKGELQWDSHGGYWEFEHREKNT